MDFKNTVHTVSAPKTLFFFFFYNYLIEYLLNTNISGKSHISIRPTWKEIYKNVTCNHDLIYLEH